MNQIMPEQSEEFKYICVDFDGTLCEERWPWIGAKKEKVLKWVLQQQKIGSKIILHTCRNGRELQEAIAWCRENGLELDAVNENPFSEFAHLGQGPKPYADLYLDDKAYRV